MLAAARNYGIAALACLVFSVVYESQSHGVYSLWMMGLFAVPLVMGAGAALAAKLCDARVSWLRRQLWACAVLTFTLGTCFAGVLEIFGTTSPWSPVFAVLGSVLALASLFC